MDLKFTNIVFKCQGHGKNMKMSRVKYIDYYQMRMGYRYRLIKMKEDSTIIADYIVEMKDGSTITIDYNVEALQKLELEQLRLTKQDFRQD